MSRSVRSPSSVLRASASRSPDPRRPLPTRWAITALVAVLVGGGALAACTSSSDTAAAFSAGNAAAGTSAAAAPAEAAGGVTQAESSAAASAGSAAGDSGSAGAAESAAPSSAGGAGSAPEDPKGQTEPIVALEGRQIIRTGSFTLSITVPKSADAAADTASLKADVSALAVKIRATAAGLGGYVSASEGDGTTQSITLRIPVAKYDAARSRLGELGEMIGSENSEDVTAALADMDGRIETMQAGVKRIRTLLSRAEKVGDVIAIESELSQREADLEALLRKRAAAGDQVALSTIIMVVAGSVGKAVAVPKSDLQITPVHLGAPPNSGFLAGVMGGFDVLRDLVRGTAAFVGALLPFLPLLLVLGLIALWWRRRVTTSVAERHS